MRCYVLRSLIFALLCAVSFPAAAVEVPQLVHSGKTPAINDLGEMVWVEFDPVTGFDQVFSSQRGQLTFERVEHRNLALNNLGEVLWVQDGAIWGLMLGLTGPTLIVNDGSSPGLNDKGEVVWTRKVWFDDIGYPQVFSSVRGQLTSAPSWHDYPSIANDGSIVWTADGNVYRLNPDVSAPVEIASGEIHAVSIANSGEVVYPQMINGSQRIFSSTRGQLTFNYPIEDHWTPVVNACGDVAFIAWPTESGIILYRLGYSAPCLDIETNNDPASATAVVYEQSLIGIVDTLNDFEDWYQFAGQSGKPLVVTVNYNSQAPNSLQVDLFDPSDAYVPVSPQYSSNRITFSLPALPASGTYKLRLHAMNGGPIAYTIKIGASALSCGASECPNLVASNANRIAINDLGEMVSIQYDATSGYGQIFSNQRGQLTWEATPHFGAALNNLGEVVWEQNTGIYGLMLGQASPTQLVNTGFDPDINDKGELVWTQYLPYDEFSGHTQIFSSIRGQLTFDPTEHIKPSIDNDGSVIWMTNGMIYRLVPGASAPEIVVNDDNGSGTISNGGEIVYHKMVNGDSRIFSNTRGQLTFTLPAGMHEVTDVNVCGDVVFTSYLGTPPAPPALYRLGNSAPCATAEDSDGDLLPDAWEIAYNLDPNSLQGVNGPTGDPDGDDLPNLREFFAGTNPINADTDGDGLNDGVDPNPLLIQMAVPANITVPALDYDGIYRISWVASAIPGACYTLEESTSSDFSATLQAVYSGVAKKVDLSGRSLATRYYYRVKATRPGFSDSDWVVAANPVAVAAGTPGAVTAPGFDADGSYTVSWVASATSGVTYTVHEASDITFSVSSGLRLVYNGQNLSVNVTGRATGKTYYYRVRASIADDLRSVWVVRPNGCAVPGPGAALAPGVPMVPASDADGSYIVSWSASATAGVNYILYEATNNTFTQNLKVVYFGPNTSFNPTGRFAGKTYYYRVRAAKPGLRDSALADGANGCLVVP